jgi:hypothetical protein
VEARLEIAKAIRSLLAQDEEAQIARRRSELAALRRDLQLIAQDLRKAVRECAAVGIEELRKAGFNPDEPRVPAGNPDGGQWTSGAASDVQSIIATARRLDVAVRPDVYEECLDLCYPLLERFQPAGSDRNTWDFHKCMNACLARNP